MSFARGFAGVFLSLTAMVSSASAYAFTPVAIATGNTGSAWGTSREADVYKADYEALTLCQGSNHGAACHIALHLGTNALACATLTINNNSNVIYWAWAYGEDSNSVNSSFASCQAAGGQCSFATTICNR